MKKNTKKKTQAQEDNMCSYAINNRIHFTVGQSGMRAGSDRAWMKSKQYHRCGTAIFSCDNLNEEVNTDD